MCNITQLLKASNIRDNRMNMRKKIISEMSLASQKSQSNMSIKKNFSEGTKCLFVGSFQGTESMTENKFHLEKKNLFFEKYELLEKIGQGANSTIYKCKSKRSNKIYAVKINKFRDQELIENYRKQFEMNVNLRNDSIIQHEELIMDNITMTSYTILEYCDFKNLKEQLYSRPQKKFTEQQVAQVLHSILEALVFLHKKGCVHRDIKPENILYNPASGQIKLIDFDCSKYKKETDHSFQMWTKTGTLNYEAPEIFSKTIYSEKVDLWAAGILAYELLTGKLPFYSSYSNKTVKMILTQDIDFQSLEVSPLMKSLLKGLLQKESRQRLNTNEALQICSHYIN